MDTITIVMVAALILKERHGGVSTSLQDAYTRIRDTIISTADAADAARNVLASLEANPTSPARQLALGELLTTIPADQHAMLRQLVSDLIEQVIVQRHGERIMQQLYGYPDSLDGHVHLDGSQVKGLIAGSIERTIISTQILPPDFPFPREAPPPPDAVMTGDDETDVDPGAASHTKTRTCQQRIVNAVMYLFLASLLTGTIMGWIVLWRNLAPVFPNHGMRLLVFILILAILYCVMEIQRDRGGSSCKSIDMAKVKPKASVEPSTSPHTMSRQQRIAKTARSLLRASLLGGSVVGLIVLWGLIVTPSLSTHAGMGLVVLSVSLGILSSSLYAVAHVRQHQLEQAEQTLLRQINQDITELLGEQR